MLGSKCEGGNQKPIKIPRHNLTKCSLLCTLEFVYPSAPWSISVVTNKGKSIQWKVHNETIESGGGQSPDLTRTDLKYNGENYQLDAIEFFLPSIHRMNCVNDSASTAAASESSSASCNERYDIEMVLKHKAHSWTASREKWLNVSVFVTPMYTYSISQDFFEQILPKSLNRDVLRGEKAVSQGEGDFPLSMHDKWSPYQGIPHMKSFYIYKGDFQYTPVSYTHLRAHETGRNREMRHGG